MKLTPEQFATLQGFVDAGDASAYYNTLGQAGHDYGNLAFQAATDSGFWGTFANNFLEEKAEQFQVPFDRDKVMRDLMERDLAERQQNERTTHYRINPRLPPRSFRTGWPKGAEPAFRRVLVWCGMLKCGLFLSVVALVVGGSPEARGSDIDYMVALSPDGSRVTVGKTQKRPQWDLFEGSLDRPLRKVPLPVGTYGTGIFQYSPDGKDLLFATAPSSSPLAPSSSERATALANNRHIGTDTLWQRRVGSGDGSPSTRIFEHGALSNVLPLLDGSIAFMGAVRRVEKPYSPLQTGHSAWTNYSWMLRKTDGSVTVVNPRQFAFFSQASLIRDEAVFFVEQRFANRQPVMPREFQINVTALKPGADLSQLVGLGSIQGSGQPQLQCDWSGRTCIRTTTYTKNKYHAHQLEIIRQGRACKVRGLRDRLERETISRDGNAVALITRPNPYSDAGYQLAHFTIAESGCAGVTVFTALP